MHTMYEQIIFIKNEDGEFIFFMIGKPLSPSLSLFSSFLLTTTTYCESLCEDERYRASYRLQYLSKGGSWRKIAPRHDAPTTNSLEKMVVLYYRKCLFSFFPSYSILNPFFPSSSRVPSLLQQQQQQQHL